MDYICTKFGIDSSSRFSFRVLITLSTHRLPPSRVTSVLLELLTPGEWQCGVRRLAVANGPNIFQMLLVSLGYCSLYDCKVR